MSYYARIHLRFPIESHASERTLGTVLVYSRARISSWSMQTHARTLVSSNPLVGKMFPYIWTVNSNRI